MTKINQISLSLSTLFICTSTILQADNFVYGNAAGGNWNNTAADGWVNLSDSNSTGALPGASDLTIVNQNKTLVVDSAITFGGNMLVQNTSGLGFDTTVEIQSGGSLSVNALTVQAGTDTGTLVVNGGALSLSGTAVNIVNNNEINVSAGSVTDTSTDVNRVLMTGTGALNLSQTGSYNGGGTGIGQTGEFKNASVNISGFASLTANRQMLGVAGTEWTITGSDASISFAALNFNTSGRAGTVNFVADEGGFSAISVISFNNMDFMNLNVDGTAINEIGTYDLFTGNLNNEANTNSVVLSGFYGVEGVDYYFEQDSTTNYARIVVNTIPEPGSYAMIAGLLALTSIMLRRRK